MGGEVRGGGRVVGGNEGNGQGSSNRSYSLKSRTDLEQIRSRINQLTKAYGPKRPAIKL